MLKVRQTEQGFTLIELIVAMAIFSSMLLIVMVGFMNIIRLHNQALAANKTQDNARSVMAELVRSVRDSAGLGAAPGPGPAGTLCLNMAGGEQRLYSVTPAGVLQRSNKCASPTSTVDLTDTGVYVSNFEATQETIGALAKPEIKITMTVVSNNNTAVTTGVGAGTCNNNIFDRAYCSTITLTSGAVPR